MLLPFFSSPAEAATLGSGGGSGGKRRPREQRRYGDHSSLARALELAALRASKELADRERAKAEVEKAVEAVETTPEPTVSVEKPAAERPPSALAARFRQWARNPPKRPITITDEQTRALADLLDAADRFRGEREALEADAKRARARRAQARLDAEAAERDDEAAVLLLA